HRTALWPAPRGRMDDWTVSVQAPAAASGGAANNPRPVTLTEARLFMDERGPPLHGLPPDAGLKLTPLRGGVGLSGWVGSLARKSSSEEEVVVGVEQWAEIRRLYFVKRLSIKEIVRRTGHGRNTIRRALRSAETPRYRRPPRPSKLDPFRDEIQR